MSLTYGSICSGIEAATVAWHPLGWEPVFFSEIEPFPCAVLEHHYPHVPNRGDMTRFQEWPDAAFDLLVGGTPCQSFSVAGLRKGMADPRGNLALTYLGIADRYRPEWLVWENVPGVLSSNDGRDFGAFLGALVELGYGFAYRVLDAQYVRVDGYERAVPQRRRRVFVVGNSRSWRRAAAVLFEPESLSWNSAPRREAGEGVAPTISARTKGGGGLGTDFDCDGGLVLDNVARCVTAGYAQRLDWETENFVAAPYTLAVRGIAWSIMPQNSGKDFKARAVDVAQPIMAGGPVGGNQGGDYIQSGWAVRRLTPKEAERLQGFHDDYSLIPWRNGMAADGPRYKALGNSMAVNVMRWLGRRIEMVQALCDEVGRAAA